MALSTEDTPVLDEAIWNAWLQKGRLREEAAAGKVKILGRVVFILLAFGGAFYLLALR